jgi:hypothetical protein
MRFCLALGYNNNNNLFLFQNFSQLNIGINGLVLLAAMRLVPEEPENPGTPA